MDMHHSDLSYWAPGVDCVVATTKASMDSNLKHYLSGNFLAKGFALVAPTAAERWPKSITLEEFAKLTDVNPTEIADGTPAYDPKVKALTDVGLLGGFILQPGLPDGVMPRDLPSAIELDVSGYPVFLNLFCKQFRIFQNAAGDRPWKSWEQTAGNLMYCTTYIDLYTTVLPNDLNTTYFNNRPNLKNPLKNRLEKLESEFGLHQVLLNIGSSVFGNVSSVPTDITPALKHMIQGYPVSEAYKASFKKAGELPLLVTVTPHDSNTSQLQITAVEHQVSHYKRKWDESQAPAQQDVSTLDYLCTVDHHNPPKKTEFQWNWVLPEERDQISGAVAISRGTIGKYILDQILPIAKRCCIQPVIQTDLGIPPYYWPRRSIRFNLVSPEFAAVEDYRTRQFINIKSIKEDQIKGNGWGYSDIWVSCNYNCNVKIDHQTIVVTQTQKLQMTCGDESVMPVNITIIDTYKVLVNSEGSLEFSRLEQPIEQDQSNKLRKQGPWEQLFDFLSGTKNEFLDFQQKATAWRSIHLKSDLLNGVQSFVFPGASIFTYKSAAFSTGGDLVCAITYLEQKVSETSSEFMKLSKTPQIKPREIRSKSLKTSSRLMQNYVHGSIVNLNSKFEALQMDDGRALLFAVGGDQTLSVIEEQHGATATGWKRYDMSSQAIKEHFGEKGADVPVRNFDAAQSALDGTIGLAMAVSIDHSDHLLVSMNNSSLDKMWIRQPRWKHIAFPSKTEIKIAGIFFTETSSRTEYLLVDLVVDDKIVRYYVDPFQEADKAWAKHDLPFDIKPGSYQSCIGRAKDAYVDGIYTRGEIGKSPQLGYVPVINAFGNGPPPVRLLKLPDNENPEAIATSRDEDKRSHAYGTTDLFATAGKTLYRWDSRYQKTGAVANPVLRNDIFDNTKALYAMTHSGVTTIWGLNGAAQVYYVSCPTSSLAVAGAWSAPVPILRSVSSLSPYINRKDGGNTIFATRGDALFKIFQATDTPSKLWKPQHIILEADAHQKSLPFTSYTTVANVRSNSDEPWANNQPAKNVNVAITADSRTPAYINGVYYILGRDPVNVLTDSMGNITVVESTDDLSAAILTFSVDGGQTTETVNPMEEPFKKAAALDTTDKLRNAQVVDNPKAGGVTDDSVYKPLVPDDVPEDDIKAAASSFKSLQEAYTTLGMENQGTMVAQDLNSRIIPATLFPPSLQTASMGNFQEYWAAPGDLYRWLEDGINGVVNVMRDAATNAWHFVVSIGNKVYRAILNTVGAVVAAVKEVLKMLKAKLKAIFNYVGHFLNWSDVRRTKEVIYNIAHQFTYHHVQQIANFKGFLDKNIDKLRDTLKKFAEIKWEGLMPDDAFKPPATASGGSPSDDVDPASHFLMLHLQNNHKAITLKSPEKLEFSPEKEEGLKGLLKVLQEAIEREGEILFESYKDLVTLTHDLKSLNGMQVVQRLVKVLAEAVLSSTKVVLDVVLDILIFVAKQLFGALEMKFHIPIISDILNDLDIPDASLMDLFCWVAATCYTNFYVVLKKEAPFPKDSAEVQAIIEADSWSTMAELFQPSIENPSSASFAGVATFGVSELPKRLSDQTKAIVFHAGNAHVGILTCYSVFLNVPEAGLTHPPSALGISSGVLGFFISAAGGAINFLTPRYPIEDEGTSMLSTTTTVLYGLMKLFFSGIIQNGFMAKWGFGAIQFEGPREFGAFMALLPLYLQEYCTVWHFVELGAKKRPSYQRTAAFLGEAANLASYGSRVAYAVAVNDPEPQDRVVALFLLEFFIVSTGHLQNAKAAIPYE